MLGDVKISVCVGSVRAATLPYLIESMRRQTFTDWEMIVVGQGAADDVEAAVGHASRADRRIRFVHISDRGVSRARNAACRAARGGILAFTDDDCEADPRWLDTINACFNGAPAIGLVGGAVVAPSRPRYALAACPSLAPAEAIYRPNPQRTDIPAGWDWIGANFAVRRETSELIGDFDEMLGPGTTFPAADDTDYKLRLEALRVPMLSTPRSIVHHTYGVRRGLGPVLALSRSYAAGNGALGAKLTLAGDHRGAAWLRIARDGRRLTPTAPGLARAIKGAYRWHYFHQAYQTCLSRFQVDGPFGSLVPRPVGGPSALADSTAPVVE